MSKSFSNFAPWLSGLLFIAPCSLLSSACSSLPEGQLIVVVTTDMALPTDIDWIDWSVTPERTAGRAGSVKLKQFDSLPGTLSILSGSVEAEPVLLRVEGRTGGENGALRVFREARLRMPRPGETKMLPMPLDWACSLETRAADCDANLDCKPDSCGNANGPEPLADFAPLEPAPCFDVLGCTFNTATFAQATPSIDTATGRCIVDVPLASISSMSVALRINPEFGNAGVCAPNSEAGASGENRAAGNCFVPVNKDAGSRGWHVTKLPTDRIVLELPHVVCDAFSAHQVLKVVLTVNDCPAKTIAQPLCEADSACVAAEASCPGGLDDSWKGYSCSGVKTPTEKNPGLKYCGISDNDPLTGRVVPGHFCCTTGPSSSEDPLLIDDMRGGPLVKLPPPPDHFPASWFTAGEDDVAISPPNQPKTFFTYRSIDRVKPKGEPSFERAACLNMPNGFPGSYALEGFSFFTRGADVVPVDVSKYAGISFWATVKGSSERAPPRIGVFFANSDTDTEHDSSCRADGKGKDNCNHFRKELPDLNDQWQKFSVHWPELEQAPDFGMRFAIFDPRVYSVDFQALGPDAAPFDFCVSQIYFIPKSEP